MALNKYQVNFDEQGNAQEPIQLPNTTPKKRTIIVFEETPKAAKRLAEDLYSLSQ